MERNARGPGAAHRGPSTPPAFSWKDAGRHASVADRVSCPGRTGFTATKQPTRKGIHLHGPKLRDLGCATISADPGRFEQIVSNLLSNAIKSHPPGGDVWLNVTCEAEQLRMSVRDTGAGIDPDFLPHVARPFPSGGWRSTTRAHAGIGVGLAIVRHLVEAHGGTIETHSDGPNRGAEFVVRRFPERAARACARGFPCLRPASGNRTGNHAMRTSFGHERRTVSVSYAARTLTRIVPIFSSTP